MRRVLLLLAALLAAVAFAQEPGTRVPSVELAPVGKVQVKAGGSVTVQLDFRVGSEFHINSNKPHSELLIPTVLKLSPTNPVAVAAVKYPDGQDMSFPFAPDEKLSVYSGDFTIAAVIKAPANALQWQLPGHWHTALPGMRPQRVLSSALNSREF